MGCWASREKYEVTREWGGQVGTFYHFKESSIVGTGGTLSDVPEYYSWLVEPPPPPTPIKKNKKNTHPKMAHSD